MTKQEFISNRQAMARSVNKLLPTCLSAMLAILLAGIPLAQYIKRKAPDTWIEGLTIIFVMALVIITLLYMVCRLNRLEKRFGLRCPVCRKSVSGLVAQIAVASGACGHCGEPVFTDAKGRPEHVAGSTR